jgi:pleiotropic regulator 1
MLDEYSLVKQLSSQPKHQQSSKAASSPASSSPAAIGWHAATGSQASDQIALRSEPGSEGTPAERIARADNSKAVITIGNTQMLVPKKAPTMPKPLWHAPWKLYRVISGHLGWVRSIAVEPGNQWFATGSGDRVIKIWDLASGQLKLSLTGHISTVRGLCVSPRQPYLFSCGEDKQVKCWDLEYNKVVRHYHGHLSAVYALDMHPTIDILTSCGRDATVRVWDMRTKACIHTLTGHTNTVADVKCQAVEPQIFSCSHDCTIRLWDLAAGRSQVTLTNHKKSVRSVALHPTQYSFASASPDNIKQWKFPDGNFMQNMGGHNAIINTLALNGDNVLVSGGDNGSMYFWDWKSGYNFQRMQVAAQPGSIESEAGIFASTFDKSGTRLITAEADKTITPSYMSL